MTPTGAGLILSKSMKHPHTKKSGFTLIELLLVIAIIGLLVTGATYALNQGRQKSRDAKRIADLSTINKALSLYLNENGSYPPSPCGYDCGGWAISNNASDWANLQADLAQFMPQMPLDPVNTVACNPWEGDCYAYAYGNVGRDTQGDTYDLMALLETPGHPESCGEKGHTYYFDDRDWCGPFSEQIYEASTQ